MNANIKGDFHICISVPLKEDNGHLRNKVELLEKKPTEVEISRNKVTTWYKHRYEI